MEYKEAIKDGNVSVEEPVVKEEQPRRSLFKNIMGDKKDITIERMDSSEIVKPRKRGRPKKKRDEEDSSDDSLAKEIATNEPYINAYEETNNMLKNTIFSIDVLCTELKEEFDNIRRSKVKGKYDIITDLGTTLSTLTNAKLSAIKELNSVTNNTQKMELNRAKDLKLNEGEDDNTAIMRLYDHIVNTPRQQLDAGFIPPRLESGDFPMMISNNNGMDIMPLLEPSEEFTPEQNRMILESNPDIKTVVVYDKNTEHKEFRVMNTATCEYITNVSVPDPFLLEDMTVNFHTGTARNANANMNFPLVVIGENGMIENLNDIY